MGGGVGARRGRIVRLIVVRHGETAWNEERRYQGWDDPPLSPAGRAAARRVGAVLRARGAADGLLLASDLRRAAETARLATGRAPDLDPRLREIDLGAFAGRTYEENRARFGTRFDAWIRGGGTPPPPHGERIEHFLERVASWLADVRARVSAAPAGTAAPVVVTHGGVIRALAGLPLEPGPAAAAAALAAAFQEGRGALDPAPEPGSVLELCWPRADAPPHVRWWHPASDALDAAALAASVLPPSGAREEDVRRRLDDLTKPPGSLGRLEDLACRLAVILGDPPPPLHPRAILVLAGDHGVVARGVSAYPAAVTAQMCRNIAGGGAAVSVLGRVASAQVIVADFGLGEPAASPGVLDRSVVRGTRDLSLVPALSDAEVERAVLAGADLVRREAADARVVALGEMGIGNTTAAAGIAAALLDLPPARLVGPGTGVDRAGIERKRRALEAALARLPAGAPPLRVLAEVGGAEIAGLVGVVLEAARRGRPVLLDGFITTAAALLAVRLAPAAAPYLIASHRSAEPGHALMLEALGLDPLLDLGLRLGEGSGAALALPLLDAAAAILREMATFETAGVSRGP